MLAKLHSSTTTVFSPWQLMPSPNSSATAISLCPTVSVSCTRSGGRLKGRTSWTLKIFPPTGLAGLLHWPAKRFLQHRDDLVQFFDQCVDEHANKLGNYSFYQIFGKLHISNVCLVLAVSDYLISDWMIKCCQVY